MQQSKLVELFRTFETKDFTLFEQYLHSPYFNTNEEVIALFKYIKAKLKLKPQFLHREVVYTAVFKKKKIDEKHLGYVMSFLLKQAENFIAQRLYDSDSFEVKYNTALAFLQRDLEKHYHYLMLKMENTEELSLENQYKISFLEYNNFLKQNIRKFDSRLQNVSNKFDFHFIYVKLKYTCEILNIEKSTGKKFQLQFIDEVVSFLENNNTDSFLIDIYFNIYRFLKNELQSDYYFLAKSIFLENHSRMSAEEKKEIMVHINNYCARKIRGGDDNFLEEMWDNYGFNLREKVLFEHGYLSEFSFKNHVTLGLRLRKYHDTETIIKQSSQMLHPEKRENALHFNLANLKFNEKKYDEALKILARVNFDDIFYNMDTKILMAKIYYETKEFEVLSSHLNTFQIFIKRNTIISDETKEGYLNFIEILIKIYKKSKSQSLLKMLNHNNRIEAKAWLQAQIKS